MRVEWFDSLDSTSMEAARRAASGELGPLWICSVEQTAGRGRSGRDWISRKGNLHATHLMPVKGDPGYSALHSFVACLAVIDTLNVLTRRHCTVGVKWPNDVMLEGRKVAGVLLEAGDSKSGRWLSIGIGLNLAYAPDEARWPATTVAAANAGPAPDVAVVLTILAAALKVRIDQIEQHGFASIRADWLKKALFKGEAIVARLPNESVTGIFETLDDDGAMVLQTGAERRRIHAGDVYFPGI